MKKKLNPKVILLAVLLLAVVAAGVTCAVVLPQTLVPHAKTYAAAFAAYRADYDKVSDYVHTFTKKDAAPVMLSFGATADMDGSLYFFRDNGSERVKRVTPDAAVMESFDRLATSFLDLGFELKTVRLENGTLTFNDSDGAFCILQTADGAKPHLANVRMKALVDGWYVAVPK